jgi:adenine-specific DNA-methyltransferase
MATNQPEKLTGTSLDISAENRAHLKALFPTVFTETKNDKGELVESIDFEKLKAELGTFSDVFESRRERYGMDWPGKKEALRLIQTPSAATLKPCREESVNFDTTENLFIEGDNLEVLKLLQKSYYGKVKMIYIDPPYNTGKEFIYPDNYTESLETYLEYAGLIDGEGKKFSTNTANEGRFHTKWLNMMYPRLYLARNLLRDDGVIFISIGDEEYANVKLIMNEVLGEENIVADMAIIRSEGGGLAKQMIKGHDYLVIYAKDIVCFDPLKRPKDIRGKIVEREGEKYWIEEDWLRKEFGKYGTCPYDEIEAYHGPSKKKEIDDGLKNGDYTLIKKSSGITIVGRLRKIDEDASKFYTVQKHLNANGVDDLRNLGLEKYFDYPKPVSLVKDVGLGCTFFSKNNYDIILDFFSGSATTAHAVLNLNKQDNGNRRFILVQLPEPTYENVDDREVGKPGASGEAFGAGYRTIADIGKERIRRVIKKIKQEQDGKLDLDQTTNQDLGFKVLKLDKSNFRQWQQLDPATPPEKVAEQLELHIGHISDKATPEDLLYEILLKAGFTPTEKIETKAIAGKNVFSIAGGALLLCLEDEVTKELINAVAELEPMQFICLDGAFHGNDQLKANAVQTFAARNMQKEKHNQIIFKTV